MLARDCQENGMGSAVKHRRLIGNYVDKGCERDSVDGLFFIPVLQCKMKGHVSSDLAR